MNDWLTTPCTLFVGTRRVEAGELSRVAVRAKHFIDSDSASPVLIFDDITGAQIEVDVRGSDADMLGELKRRSNGVKTIEQDSHDDVPRRPVGRPRLGVVAREVTLLPRHWDWLASQPGGASAALRKLVDAARHANEGKDRVRQSQEAAYRFMSALAGNLEGFEEATRALFAANRDQFLALIDGWPTDIREYASKLATEALAPQDSPPEAMRKLDR